MVKRLIDEQGLESTDQRLADLFRVAAPFEADPFRKRRVLVSLSRLHTRRVSPFWLRPVIVATLLVSGTATAALGHRYVTHGSGLFGFGAPAVTATPSVQAVPVRVQAAAASPVVSNDAPAAASDALVDTTPADAVDPPPSTVRPAAKGSAHTRPDSNEDATHVVEAIQALRTEKDPSRAQGLLNDYLKTHPNGVLSEDAMALSIEAASAQHDPRAADYARRYLAKFPQGKYRDLANRALAKH
ncbi:MAG TPA: hypothetical protein VK745_24110 [Polyangiaceae bacterium]|nr:hypothetical protein [Polyangiaceae bacterium]